MNYSVGWKVYGSFILVFTILCYLSYLSYRNAEVLIFDTQSVDTSSAFVYELQGLTSALRDAEMTNSVYILLGKARYLDSYKDNVAQLLKQLQKVQKVKNGPLDPDLEKLIHAKIYDMDLATAEREKNGLNSAMQVFLTGNWRKISDDIQNKIEFMKKNHGAILKTQTVKQRQSKSNTIHSALLAGGMVFVLFIIAVFIIRYEIVKRLKYEQLLEKARGEAIQASEFKSQFLANMSHEIRTPMNGIMGMATVLTESNLSVQQVQYAEIIKNSCQALLRVINDVLDFSKVEAGKLDIYIENFNLKNLLNEIETLFIPLVRKKNIELRFQLEDKVPFVVMGDSGRIRQIFNNLIGNAIKFTEKGFVVVSVKLLETTNTSHKIYFEISDTGVGIPLESQKKIFGAFEQAEADTGKRFGGTGLGLNISKKLVELMAGQISFSSEPGKGSRFWFSLEFPFGQSEVSSAIVNAPGEIEFPEGMKALVAEDDSTSREVITNYLNKMGIRVDIVNNGKEAVDKFVPNYYDFIFFDVQMPLLNGFEALKQIRDIEKNKDNPVTPAFFVTANMGLEKSELLKELQVKGIISKPIQFEKFQTQVRLISRTARILIADDSETNQDILKIFLSTENFLLDFVSSGEAALDLIKNKNYDLILMDIQMPGIGGLEATRLIRLLEKERKISSIPILAFTAGVTEKELQECHENGCNGHVEKPVEKEKLISSIKKFLKLKINPEGANG